MADKTELLQAIDDAILDADSLEQFINGSDSETVLTRLSAEYPTLQKALKELFENGGIADRFKTLADLQASSLVDGDYALVADDADEKNGIYIKEGGSWVKSSYDPISYIDNKAASVTPIYLIPGNTSSVDGSTSIGSPSIATSPTHIRTYAGDILVLRGAEGDPSFSIEIAKYDLDKNFILRETRAAQHEVDRFFTLDDGYIKVNALLGGELDKALIQRYQNSLYIKSNKLNPSYVQQGSLYQEITTNVPLEIGYLVETGDTYTNSGHINSTRDLDSTTYNFLGERRSRKPLEVISNTPATIYCDNGIVRVFEYDSELKVVMHYIQPSGESFVIGARTKYIKISITEVTVTEPKVTIKLMALGNTANYIFNANQPNRLYSNISFIYEAYPSEGRDIYGSAITTPQFTQERYFNSGILKLPPNYDPLGEPVKIIIFVQGSAGFLGFSAVSIGPGYESLYSDEGIFNYWLNEGYAVLGVFPWTSKYPIAAVSTNNGTPTAMAAYAQGYQWAIENYNLARDGVYVSGKSSGGFCGVLLAHQTRIPVKAVAMMAPVISPMPFGPNEETRKQYANDLGFEGDHSVLNNRSSTSPAIRYTEEYYNYLRQNAEKMVGYNPDWCGIINVGTSELIERHIQGATDPIAANSDLVRVCPTPIKFWAAKDDDRVNSYEQSKIYVDSIRRAQGNAELRTMPDGTGGHSSVDTDPDAIKIPTVTTKLGLVHKNVPIAIAEIVSYFRRFD